MNIMIEQRTAIICNATSSMGMMVQNNIGKRKKHDVIIDYGDVIMCIGLKGKSREEKQESFDKAYIVMGNLGIDIK